MTLIGLDRCPAGTVAPGWTGVGSILYKRPLPEAPR